MKTFGIIITAVISWVLAVSLVYGFFAFIGMNLMWVFSGAEGIFLVRFIFAVICFGCSIAAIAISVEMITGEKE